jgi:hypothetical protein
MGVEDGHMMTLAETVDKVTESLPDGATTTIAVTRVKGQPDRVEWNTRGYCSMFGASARTPEALIRVLAALVEASAAPDLGISARDVEIGNI